MVSRNNWEAVVVEQREKAILSVSTSGNIECVNKWQYRVCEQVAILSV